jgi:allantoin racemase
MTRICYFGPPGRQEALQAFVSPPVTVETRTPKGPVSIESMYEEMLLGPGLIELAVEAEEDGVDAIVPGCFGDPGIDAMREVVTIPVVAPGATSMLLAMNLGHRFSIITVINSIVRPLENLALLVGASAKLASVRTIGVPVLSLNTDPDATFERLVDASREALERDRADVLVLGCGTLSFRADELQERLGVPVLNPLRVALRTAEMLVAMGVSHSKRSHPWPPKGLLTPELMY